MLERMKKKAIRMEELSALRGRDRAVYRMSDGTHQAEYYAAPRFVRGGDGAWDAVDNTLVPAADGKHFENRRGTFTARFNREAGEELFSLAEGNCRVTVSQLHAARGAAALHRCGNTGLRWENAGENLDLEYAVTDTGVKETIVVKAPAAEYRYAFRLHGERVVPLLNERDRRITFVNEEGTADVFQIPAPVMQDAAGVLSEAVTYALTPMEDGDWLFTVTADAAWLNDPARVFPVAIDPTVETLPRDVVTYEWNGTALTKTGGSVLIASTRVGDTDVYTENGMLLRLNPPALPQNALVQKVEVVFTQPAGPGEPYPRIGLYRVENELAEGAFTPQNPVLLDYDRTAFGVRTEYAFDVTKQVQEGLSTLNLMVKTVDADRGMGQSFRLYGHNSAYAPKFVVTYDPAYVTAPNARTHTHELGRFGQGAVDIYRGNLTWECEDFAWGGNRLPVTLKHRFNSALAGKQYTAGCAEGLHVADFSAMKIGTGFALNVMQSVVPTYKEDGVTVDAYHYVDENGCDTVLTAHTDENGNVTHYADEDEVYTYTVTETDRKLQSGDETLTFDEEGRLVEIRDGYGNTQTVTYEDGRITAVTDGASRVFAFAYDATGHLTSITAPDGSRVCYSYTYDLLTHASYPGGGVVEIQYGTARPSAIIACDKTWEEKYKVRYTWTENGCIASMTEYAVENGAEVQGNVTTFNYDPVARRAVVTVAEPTDGSETAIPVHTVYAFDGEGEVVSEYAYTVNGNNIHPCEGSVSGIADSVNLLKNHTFTTDNGFPYLALSGDTDWKPKNLTNSVAEICYYNRFSDEYYANSLHRAPYNQSSLGVNTLQATGNPVQVGAYQTVNDLPCGEYTFSAYVWVKPTELGNNTRAYLRVVNANGSVLAQSEMLRETDAWMRLVVPFNLNVSSNVQVQMLTNGIGCTFFNAPQLENNAYATAYNSLENGSFEQNEQIEDETTGVSTLEFAGWTRNATVAPDVATGFNGAQALQLTNQFDTQCAVYQDVVVKGAEATRETFTLSGWAKGNGFPVRDRHTENEHQFCLRAEIVYAPEWLDDGTKRLYDPEVFTADFNGNTEDWQFASVQFCKSHFAKVDHIRVYCDYGQNIGTACFDGVKLVRNMLETNLTEEDFATEEEEIAPQSDGGDESENTEPTFEEVHDAYGNPLTETTFTDGELGAIYRAFGYRNGYAIAEREGNDLVSETDTRGNVTHYAVDELTSRNEEVIDRCGNKTAYEYDEAGRVTRVVNTGADGTAYGTVDYTYDMFDNLTAITRGDGMQYALAYDTFRNLASIGIAGEAEKLVQYTYKNGNGRLKEITYANGDKMTATYNGQGQMVAEKWYKTTADAQPTLTAHYKYVYDNDGNIVRSIDICGTKEYTYTYEDGVLTRAAAYHVTVGANEIITARSLLHSVLMVYDGTGTLVKKEFTTANGTTHVVEFTNAENNSTATFTVGETATVCSSATDHFGRKTSDEIKVNGTRLSRTFVYHDGVVAGDYPDASKLPSSPTTQLVSEITFSDGRTIAYEYDAEERITKVTDSVDGITEYTYDALGQLLTEKVNGNLVNRMTYDSYGNILSKNGVRYIYDTVWRDKLIAYGDETCVYDAQGNPTTYRGHALTWEKGRQLKSFDNIQYTYNANGIRTSKTVNGVKHTYTLDGTKILREVWGGNVLMPLYDNEDSVCGILYNSVPYYFIKNLQGDIITVTDATGDVKARYTYDAWGVCTVTQDDNGVGAVNPFRYRGYYYDTETQLYYLQSRYYNSVVGRFVNADEPEMTLGINPVSENLLAYGDCCPVVAYDPHGFKAVDITKKLTKLMRKNALNFLWHIIKKVCLKGVVRGMVDVFKYFYDNSKTNGSWDLKNKGWKVSSKDWYVFKGKKLRQDDPGNIHFGYVGSVLFGLTTLRAGAGVYQLYSGTSKWYYALTFFDDPRDSSMIGWGHVLFATDVIKTLIAIAGAYLWLFKEIAKKLWSLQTKYYPKKPLFI